MTKLIIALIVGGVLTIGYGLKNTKTTDAAGATTATVFPKLLNGSSGYGLKNEEVSLDSEKSVKRLNFDPARTLFLVGVIDVTSTVIAHRIGVLSEASEDPIYLVIDSPGGQVFGGTPIISAIQASKAPVYTVCYRLCASMAAIIHQYGTMRLAADRAVIMFHPASAGYEGDINRIESFAHAMRLFIDKMDFYIANRIGMDFSAYKALVANEWWLDAESAQKAKVVDQLVYLDAESSALMERVFRQKINLGEKAKHYNLVW